MSWGFEFKTVHGCRYLYLIEKKRLPPLTKFRSDVSPSESSRSLLRPPRPFVKSGAIKPTK